MEANRRTNLRVCTGHPLVAATPLHRKTPCARRPGTSSSSQSHLATCLLPIELRQTAPTNAPRPPTSLASLRTMQRPRSRTGCLVRRRPRPIVSPHLSRSCTHGLLIAMAGLCVDHGFEPATGGHPHVSEDGATKPGEARPRGSEDTSKMSHEPFKPEEPTFQPTTHRLQNIRADPNSVQFLVSTKNQTCSAKDVEVGDGSLQIVASGEEALARIAEALGSPQSISAARQSSQVSRFDSYGRGQVLGTAQMQREQDRNRK